MPNRKSEKSDKKESIKKKEINKTKRNPRKQKNTPELEYLLQYVEAGQRNPSHVAIAQSPHSDSDPLYLNLSINGNY